MEEEAEYSILEEKFREWFGKTVPVATPLPGDGADRLIETPVPAAVPLTAEAYNLNHRLRRRPVDNSLKLFKFLGSGFIGAAYLGALVGFIIAILNIGGWPDHWPNPYLVIFFVMTIGFSIGLAKGYVSQRDQP